MIFALETSDGDVVADDILVGVNAVLEHSVGALEATGELVHGVDNLVGLGGDTVCRCECEWGSDLVGLEENVRDRVQDG